MNRKDDTEPKTIIRRGGWVGKPQERLHIRCYDDNGDRLHDVFCGLSDGECRAQEAATVTSVDSGPGSK